MTFMTVHLYGTMIYSHQSSIGSIFNNYIFFFCLKGRLNLAPLGSELSFLWSVELGMENILFKSFFGQLSCSKLFSNLLRDLNSCIRQIFNTTAVYSADENCITAGGGLATVFKSNLKCKPVPLDPYKSLKYS